MGKGHGGAAGWFPGRRGRAGALAALGMAALMLALPGSASASPGAAGCPRTPLVLNDPSYGFNSPTAIGFDGRHLWIVNYTGRSLTEVNASDGSLVRIVGANYSPSGLPPTSPAELVFGGGHLWLANYNYIGYGDNVIAEINVSDGSTVKILGGIGVPNGLAYHGNYLWVASAHDMDVTERNTSDGSVVNTFAGPEYGITYPSAPIAFYGSRMWVANGSGITGIPDC